MAESAVQILMKTIATLLDENDPGINFRGARTEIFKMKLELESMTSFLRDAEKCQVHNAGLDAWMAQVRDVSFKAEDVIDEYLYHFGSEVKEGGLKEFIRRSFHFPKEIWLKFRTRTKLNRIKGEIKDIAQRSKRYDLSNMEGASSSHDNVDYAQSVKESSFFIKSSEIVGVEKQREFLMESLTSGKIHRTAITLVGMGGSGKTTLAANVFNDPTVKKWFCSSAWVSVTPNFTIEELLRKVITEFYGRKGAEVIPSLSTMDYKHLVENLVHFLHDRRFLIVFDDVWSSSLWRQVSVFLPDNKNGSRVIITTRKEDVASYCCFPGSHILPSQPLSKDDAMTLFCKKAFCNEPANYLPPELEKITEALVEKCEGLPLAVVALGGLMARKVKSELKWKEIYDSLSWHLSNNPLLDDVKTILLLSYRDLPYYLKNCFLYCCRFPRGQSIGAGRLIRMWMGEGFLEERRGFTPEQVAKTYLEELISRSLFQVERHNTFLRPKTCKLHDLMWEIALSVSKEENFLAVCDPQEMKHYDEFRARHLSVTKVDMTFHVPTVLIHVRSFSAFNFEEKFLFPFEDFVSSFRLLRMLELRDAPIEYLPKKIGKLFNLRYLGLKRTAIKELPKSVGSLRNLQTLDIRRTKVRQLPDEISKLQNLRHLLTYTDSADEKFNYTEAVEIPPSICKLSNLQVVNSIAANADIVKGIEVMTQLRRIALTNLKEEHGSTLCTSIDKLQSLRHVLLMANDEREVFRLDILSSSPPNFRKLTLIGRFDNVPRWFPFLQNVIHLHLHWSQLMDDPIPYICNLPSLESLSLVNAYCPGKNKLSFSEGFQKLEVLRLSDLPDLVEICISQGVMPTLECLFLNGCTKLHRVPLGIENLHNLKVLELKDASMELIERVRVRESIDYLKVSHIPVIKHLSRAAASAGTGYEKLS